MIGSNPFESGKKKKSTKQPTVPLTFASLDIDFDDWYGKNYPNQDKTSEHRKQTNLAFLIYKLTCHYLSPLTQGYQERRQALSALVEVKKLGLFNKKTQTVPLGANDKAALQISAMYLKDASTKTLASQVIKACLAQKALPELTSTPIAKFDDEETNHQLNNNNAIQEDNVFKATPENSFFGVLNRDVAIYLSGWCQLSDANNLMQVNKNMLEKTKESVDVNSSRKLIPFSNNPANQN